MPVTISESDSFPSTLTAPAAGESASAPGLVSQFLQGIANRSRWLFNRVNVWVAGGALTPSDIVNVTTPTTKLLEFNDLRLASNADGGLVQATGSSGMQITSGPLAVSAGPITASGDITSSGGDAHAHNGFFNGNITKFDRATAGSPAAGTHQFSIDATELIYNVGSGSGSCNWKLLNGLTARNSIRLFNGDTNPINIQDSAGNPIVYRSNPVVLSSNTGAMMAVTLFTSDGGTTWTVIDLVVHP